MGLPRNVAFGPLRGLNNRLRSSRELKGKEAIGAICFCSPSLQSAPLLMRRTVLSGAASKPTTLRPPYSWERARSTEKRAATEGPAAWRSPPGGLQGSPIPSSGQLQKPWRHAAARNLQTPNEGCRAAAMVILKLPKAGAEPYPPGRRHRCGHAPGARPRVATGQ